MRQTDSSRAKKLRKLIMGLLMLAMAGTFSVAPLGSAITQPTAEAALSAAPPSGEAPLLVDFAITAGPPSSSNCPADLYTLDFGDGSPPAAGSSAGPLQVSHSYVDAGTFVASLHYVRFEDVGVARPDCQAAEATDSLTIEVVESQPLRFIGTDSDWFNPDNWSGGRVPGPDDDVVIDDGALVVIDPENDATHESGTTGGAAGKVVLQDLGLTGNAVVEMRQGTRLEVRHIRLFDDALFVGRSSWVTGESLSYEGPGCEPCAENPEACSTGYGGSGVLLNPIYMKIKDVKGAFLPMRLFLGGAEPTGPDGVGPGHYATLNGDVVDIDGACLQVDLIYDFEPRPGDSFSIINATESLTGRFSGLDDGDPVARFDDVVLVIRYLEKSIVLEAQQTSEPLRFVGTDSDWFNPDNWGGGRVPGPDDDVIVPDGASVKLEGQRVRLRSIEVHGELDLVSSCLEIQLGGWGYGQGTIKMNPSCLVANSIDDAGEGMELALYLGGTEPATPGEVGPGHYASVRAESIILRGSTLEVDTIYDFSPRAGDTFVILEATRELIGQFDNLNDGDVAARFGDVVLVIGYLEMSVVLEAQQASEPLRFVGTDSDWFNPENWDQGRVPGPFDDVVIDGDFTIVIDPEMDATHESGTTGGGAGKVVLRDFSLIGNAVVESLPGSELNVQTLTIDEAGTLRLESSLLRAARAQIALPVPRAREELMQRGLVLRPFTCSWCTTYGNPSALVFDSLEIVNAATQLYLGGTTPAAPDQLGPGHYATIRAESILLDNAELEIDTIYDFSPSPGDRFVLVEASESLTGQFSNALAGEEVARFGDVALIAHYEQNSVVLEAVAVE